MRITLLEDAPDGWLSSQLSRLLHKYDTAFVPPLSQRAATTQSDLRDPLRAGTGGNTDAYLDALKEQSFVLAIDDETDTGENVLAGFLSFRGGFRPPSGFEEIAGRDYWYVSTLIVDEKYRGRNLGRSLYRRLFNRIREGEDVHEGERFALTRTWDSEREGLANKPHMRILDGLGFELALRLRDDRGEGIDTVYYMKRF